MPIEMFDKGDFVLISYEPHGLMDFRSFKETLVSLLGSNGTHRDIVIDFGSTEAITSTDIGSIVWLADMVRPSPFNIHIISKDALYSQLSSLSLLQVEHLILYRNRRELADQPMPFAG
jgi:hypothetical protein